MDSVRFHRDSFVVVLLPSAGIGTPFHQDLSCAWWLGGHGPVARASPLFIEPSDVLPVVPNAIGIDHVRSVGS